MITEKHIGKKVWLKGSDGTIKDKTPFIVKSVKDGKDCNDWCNHCTIENPTDGKTIDVREYDIVVALDDEVADEYQRLANYLSDNGLYAEILSLNDDTAIVAIEWGDWKHDHIWCEYLMSYIGYKVVDEYNHYFVKENVEIAV